MPGKITFRHPQDFIGQSARWIGDVPVDISAKQWKRMEDAIGRRLEKSERDRIHEFVQEHATIADQNKAIPTSQDIKATLDKLANLPLANVRSAYKFADDWTRAQIATAMLRDGVRERVGNPTDEQIQHFAAVAALMFKGTSGRRRRGSVFASRVRELWSSLGGDDERISARNAEAGRAAYASPIVKFAMPLHEAAKMGYLSERGMADKLAVPRRSSETRRKEHDSRRKVKKTVPR